MSTNMYTPEINIQSTRSEMQPVGVWKLSCLLHYYYQLITVYTTIINLLHYYY